MGIFVDVKGFHGYSIIPKYNMTLNNGETIEKLSRKQLLNFIAQTLQEDSTAIINCPIELESNIEKIRMELGE